MSGNVCKYFQFGYYKLDNRCVDVHIEEKCEVEQCTDLNCKLRHPRDCRYMKYLGFCKFGVVCAFKHNVSRTLVPNLIVDETLQIIIQSLMVMAKFHVKTGENSLIFYFSYFFPFSLAPLV